jgi:hypothetical protein
VKIIYISPINGYNVNLFPYFYETFAAKGHTWVTDPNEATHCFLELQIEENRYPKEIHTIIERDIPIICFDNREYGEGRPEQWTEWFGADIYFIRNMRKSFTYPENCYPFDWAVFKNSEHPLATKEELFSRPYDCSFIGTLSKTREKFTTALLRDGRLKFDFQDRDHTKRFSTYEQYLNEHRKAKLYISCDGAGLTNERPMQLYTVAAMLKNKSDLRSANSYIDLVNCIEVNEEPTKEDIDKILMVVNDKDWLYDIYMGGVTHAKNYLSHEYVSNYVLNTISGNNI